MPTPCARANWHANGAFKVVSERRAAAMRAPHVRNGDAVPFFPVNHWRTGGPMKTGCLHSFVRLLRAAPGLAAGLLAGMLLAACGGGGGEGGGDDNVTPP